MPKKVNVPKPIVPKYLFKMIMEDIQPLIEGIDQTHFPPATHIHSSRGFRTDAIVDSLLQVEKT